MNLERARHARNLTVEHDEVDGNQQARKDGKDKDDDRDEEGNSKQRTFVCDVCFDEWPISEQLVSRVSASCIHDSDTMVCRPCLQRHICYQIVLDLPKINCWKSGCEANLTYDEVQGIVDHQTLNKYGQQLAQRSFDFSEKLVHCAAANCEGVFLCDKSTTSFVGCPLCSSRTCIDCGESYHEGTPCPLGPEGKTEAETQAAENRASQAEVEKISKACPKCGVRIQKDGGCDHMACRYNMDPFDVALPLTTDRRTVPSRVLLAMPRRLSGNQERR